MAILYCLWLFGEYGGLGFGVDTKAIM